MATTRKSKSDTATKEINVVTDTINTLPDEATAVVEFSSSTEFLATLDKQSMLPRCLNSFTMEELLSAHETVALWNPNITGDTFDAAIRRLITNKGMRPDRAKDTVLQAIANLNLDSNYRVGDGKLGSTSNRVNYTHEGPVDPHNPYICFVSLRTSSPTFVEGKREAMAVAYFPTAVTDPADYGKRGAPMLRWPDQLTGEMIVYPNFEYLPGYSHVIRFFASYDIAKAAKLELQDALATCRKVSKILADEEYRNDPVRNVIHGPSDDEKRKFGQRTTVEESPY